MEKLLATAKTGCIALQEYLVAPFNILSTDLDAPSGLSTISFSAISENFDIDMVIDVLKEQHKATVLANPKVLTLDNLEAKI